jgi:hypothetical protein
LATSAQGLEGRLDRFAGRQRLSELDKRDEYHRVFSATSASINAKEALVFAASSTFRPTYPVPAIWCSRRPGSPTAKS